MTDDKDGDPRSVKHLRPDTIPTIVLPRIITGNDAEQFELMLHQLEMLRAPFPPEEWEKRPQPMFKGAWDGGRKQKCDECGGWHVLENTVHLEYIGHAGVTKRFLEVDPLWSWKPLARDENGLPKFDKFGGLWIKLTICGVTRLGYGDAVGKDASSTAVKEIVGDGLRNAGMRFGVALEFWSKVDRHEGKNPDVRGALPPRAENQDALDELASICNEHGYSTEYVATRFAEEHEAQWIRTAESEAIRVFGQKLIAEAIAEPAGDAAVPADGGDLF